MINYLDWDSNFFSIKVGTCKKFDDKTINESHHYDLIYCYNETGSEILKFNPHLEKTFQETKIIYLKKDFVGVKDDIQIKTAFDLNLEKEDLVNLAYQSGEFSRFKLDPKFSIEQFKDLYGIWVENSLNKKIADEIFVFQDDNKIKGFVSIALKNDNTAQIGLIAVDSKYQGRGVGKRLIEKTEDYLLKKNIETLLIPTQKENINACLFYEKMGYNIVESINIEHLWRK